MTDNYKTDPFSLIPRLFKLISDLTEDQQLLLLKQLLGENIKPHLFKAIIGLNEKQQIELLESLEATSSVETPIKTVSLDDEQASMRAYLRKSCYIEARVSIGGQHYPATISDISTVGVFIEVGEPLPKGQPLDISFSLPNSAEPLRLNGMVAWIGQGGFGIRLGQLTADEEKAIHAYIQPGTETRP